MKLIEPIRLDGLAQGSQEVLVEHKVMVREHDRSQHLLGLEEMPDVTPAETRTDPTTAIRIQRSAIGPETVVADPYFTFRGEC